MGENEAKASGKAGLRAFKGLGLWLRECAICTAAFHRETGQQARNAREGRTCRRSRPPCELGTDRSYNLSLFADWEVIMSSVPRPVGP